jgi:hypothetical protein
MRITLEKTKHHKHGSEDKIKNHKNLDNTSTLTHVVLGRRKHSDVSNNTIK